MTPRTPHPFQSSIDSLPEYLTDAYRLNEVVEQRVLALVNDRKRAGNSGSGAPTAHNKALNRAVVVAAVGALEAYCEDLAMTAVPLFPDSSVANTFQFSIASTRGMVQTPSSQNIAKMLWVYFRYDPRPDWELHLLSAPAEEVAGGSSWRVKRTVYRGAKSASQALDAMVKVRHGFAHQDKANHPPKTPGVVSTTPSGKLSLQSHHAFNSISLVLQIALQTTQGLTAHLGQVAPPMRWRKSMDDACWYNFLEDTPAFDNYVFPEWQHSFVLA